MASSASSETPMVSSEVAMDIQPAPSEPTPLSSAAPSFSGAPHYTYQRSAGQSMSDLAFQLEDYPPTMPDPVVKYYMNSAGFATSDHRITRLISMAAQKFISDIANDALQHCKMRGAGQTKKAAKDKRYLLTMEDLTPALAEYGMNAKKPHYFS